MFSANALRLPLSRISVHGDRLQGSAAVNSWSRLNAVMLQVDTVAVAVDLTRKGQVVIAEGVLQLSGTLRCERCLGAMPLMLTVPVRSGLADLESAVLALDPNLEVVLAENGFIDQQSWLEDEVLLALPMVPRCAEWQSGVCPVSGREPLTEFH